MASLCISSILDQVATNEFLPTIHYKIGLLDDRYYVARIASDLVISKSLRQKRITS